MTTTKSPATVSDLRAATEARSTEALIGHVEALEDKARRTEAERLSYAVACGVLARRLGLDARTVATSTIGPAATFRAASL